MLRTNRSLKMQLQTGIIENITGCFCLQQHTCLRNVLSNLIIDRSFIPQLHSLNTCYLNSCHASRVKDIFTTDKPCMNVYERESNSLQTFLLTRRCSYISRRNPSIISQPTMCQESQELSLHSMQTIQRMLNTYI